MALFEKGKSGNPAGKPKGAKDKRTELRALLEPHAGKLIAKAVELALAGDVSSLRICIDRICPTLKPQAESAAIEITGSPSEQAQQVVAAVAAGDMAPDFAETIMGLLADQVRIEDMTEVKKDIEEIKALLKANKRSEEEYQWQQQQQQQFKNSKNPRR